MFGIPNKQDIWNRRNSIYLKAWTRSNSQAGRKDPDYIYWTYVLDTYYVSIDDVAKEFLDNVSRKDIPF